MRSVDNFLCGFFQSNQRCLARRVSEKSLDVENELFDVSYRPWLVPCQFSGDRDPVRPRVVDLNCVVRLEYFLGGCKCICELRSCAVIELKSMARRSSSDRAPGIKRSARTYRRTLLPTTSENVTCVA
jgi:hypothetical protein